MLLACRSSEVLSFAMSILVRRQHGGQDRALLSFDLEAGTTSTNRDSQFLTFTVRFSRFAASVSLESKAAFCIRFGRVRDQGKCKLDSWTFGFKLAFLLTSVVCLAFKPSYHMGPYHQVARRSAYKGKKRIRQVRFDWSGTGAAQQDHSITVGMGPHASHGTIVRWWCQHDFVYITREIQSVI